MDQITSGGAPAVDELPSEAAYLPIRLVPYPGGWLLRLAEKISRMNPAARWFRRDLGQRIFPACSWPQTLQLAGRQAS